MSDLADARARRDRIVGVKLPIKQLEWEAQEVATGKIEDPIMVLAVNDQPILRSGERRVSAKNSTLQRALAVTKSL